MFQAQILRARVSNPRTTAYLDLGIPSKVPKLQSLGPLIRIEIPKNWPSPSGEACGSKTCIGSKQAYDQIGQGPRHGAGGRCRPWCWPV